MHKVLPVSIKVLSVSLAAAVGIGGFIWLSLRLRDAEPNPNTVVGKERLQAMAQTAQPLQAALDSYRHDHRHFPAALGALYPKYLPTPVPPSGNTWQGWYYSVDPTTPSPQEYFLNLSVGRDPVLRYSHQSTGTRWYYDPGTGAEKILLHFTQAG
ncbi:MAG: hypothetical protein ACRYFS_14060 [Janthinobacterium lividum]